MADDGHFVKNADILARAGINANVVAKATAATDIYVEDVESMINCATRHNWSDSFASMNSRAQGLLIETGACLCAINVIAQDMSGFTSRIEAEDMINVLRDTALRNISIMRDKKTQEFMLGIAP